MRVLTAVLLGLVASAASAQGVPNPTDLNDLDLTVRHRVRAVWFAPNDRPFPAGIHQRLDNWVRITQDFYRDEMARWGYLDEFGRGKSFVIDQDEGGMWDVVFMVGDHPTAYYQNQSDPAGPSFGEIFARLPVEFHNDNVTMYFYDTYVVSGESFAYTGNGGSGAPWEGEGAGYVAQGTHFLGPDFDVVALDREDQAAIFLQGETSNITDLTWDGQLRELTRGEFASTYFSVPIHEVGHAFYLPHIFSDTDGDGFENNIMGNGFRHFGGRYGMPGPDQSPTILSPEGAEMLDNAIMFNQPDPFAPVTVSTTAVLYR